MLAFIESFNKIGHWFINECFRKKKAKIPESQNPGVMESRSHGIPESQSPGVTESLSFLVRYRRTYVLNKAFKASNLHS